jgi:hypothetical protein
MRMSQQRIDYYDSPEAPKANSLVHAVNVAAVNEECFKAAKNETGLGHYQVRRYLSWYRPRHPRLARLGVPRRLPGRSRRGRRGSDELSRSSGTRS